MSWCRIPHQDIALFVDNQLITRHWLAHYQSVAGKVFILS